jgi:hypothetical protein
MGAMVKGVLASVAADRNIFARDLLWVRPTMRDATSLGMTEEDVRQDEQRRARIGELVRNSL